MDMQAPLWMLQAIQTPQIGIDLATLVTAVGPALGSLAAGLFSGAQQGSGQKRDKGWDNIDRHRYLLDRDNEREFAIAQKADDRRYAAETTADARRHEQNEWTRQHEVQRNAMLRDWRQHQLNADFRAEASRNSRGFNLQKLRKEAEAAGFNPLTLMSMGLGGYSTEIGYNAVAPGVTGAASGGSGVTGFAGGGSYAGAGYQRAASSPLMSSGGFIQEAVQRGLDTLFNQPANDPLADALREAMSFEETVQEAKSKALPPQGFGYDLTKVEPYSASKSVGVPPLSERPAQNPANLARMKTRKVRDVGGNVVSLDDSIAERLDIPEYGQMMAGDLAEVFGEIPGEAEAAIRAENIRSTAMPTGGVRNIVPPLSAYKQGPAAAGAAVRRYLKKHGWFN